MSSETFAAAPPSLMQHMGEKALRLGVPISVQLDLTYRCNERCIHCYLDHDDHGEMNTAEIMDLLEQMAEAGVFFLTISGGEILMRQDFFEILEYARKLMFCVKLKTNAVMIREEQAARLARAAIDSVQISIYSHRAEVHDAITKLPGSLRRSVAGANVAAAWSAGVFRQRADEAECRGLSGVRALAEETDAIFRLDPTMTPMMDGDRGVLELNVDAKALREVFPDEGLVGDADGILRAADWAAGACGCDGDAALQRGAHGVLRVAVWGRLPLRAVSIADWKRAQEQISGYLEAFAGDERSAVDHARGPADCSTCAHGGTARGARGWRTWKATCGGRRARTVRSRLCGLGWRRRG